MTKPFQFSLAPENLFQAINPWTFNFPNAHLGTIEINLGLTQHPKVEREILDEVGSYGRQLGRIGDALEVIVKHFDATKLSPLEQDALASLLGQLADIRAIKRRSELGVDK